MGRGNEIDIMTTLFLQIDHQPGQVISRYSGSCFVMTDVVVLTKLAPKVAVGKKNSAGAVAADEGRFFAMVGKGTGNDEFFARLTDTSLSFLSIDAASAGAESAGAQDVFEALYSTSQIAGLMEENISWGERHYFSA